MRARTLKRRPAAILMMVLCVGAAAVISTARPWLATPDPGAQFAAVRLVLAVMWTLLSALSLACVYRASRAGFGAICGLTAAWGMATMAVGREGVFGIDRGLIACVFAAVLIAAASSIWLTFRSATVTGAERVWRLFLWLSSMAPVYLYSAEPREAGSHLAAFAVAMLGCALVMPLWPAILRVAAGLLHASPRRLSMVAWAGAVGALAVNVIVARALGTATPQVTLGPVSVAPYFIAAALTLAAVALDVEHCPIEGSPAMVRMAAGLALCSALFVVGLNESGILAVVLLGTAAIMVIAGTPLIAGAAIGTVAIMQFVLQSHAVIAGVQQVLPRVGQRLAAWSLQAQPPDQLLRVSESLEFAGALGHAGAARLRFLIGPEVAKDYAPALIAVQGGWVGLALVLLASVLLLIELYIDSRRTKNTVGRALQTGILALIVANLLATTLWLGGTTPFVGVPLPLLARAGSHLLVLTLVLLAYDAVSQSDHVPSAGRQA